MLAFKGMHAVWHQRLATDRGLGGGTKCATHYTLKHQIFHDLQGQLQRPKQCWLQFNSPQKQLLQQPLQQRPQQEPPWPFTATAEASTGCGSWALQIEMPPTPW